MLLIKNAKILTMEGKNIASGDVCVENGLIREVGVNLSAPGATVVDAKGLILSPGLIDAHCHIGMFNDAMGFEGEDGNEMVQPVTPGLRAIDSINPYDRCFEEARRAGVTGLCTGPGSGNVVGGLFAFLKNKGGTVENMVSCPAIALKAAFGENPKRVYNAMKKSPTTRMATAHVLRQALIDARDYIDKNLAAESPKDKPKRSLDMEALAMVVEKKIPLKIHAHRADDILTAIRIAKEFDIDFTLDHCTEGYLIADELLKSGTKGIIIGPLLSSRSQIELLNLSYDAPRVLYEHKIPFAMMTDHPVIPEQYLAVCAALAVQCGLPEEEARKSVTINAAKVLGLDHKIGSVKKGKDADLVLFSHDPLDFRARAKMVWVDGTLVWES